MITDTKTVWGEGEVNHWVVHPSQPILNRHTVQYCQASSSRVVGVSAILLPLGQCHPVGLTMRTTGKSRYSTSYLAYIASAELKIPPSKLLYHEGLSVMLPNLFYVLTSYGPQDLTFELKSGNFNWRWETYNQGPKISANVISRQLVIPLINLNHLAFSTAESLSELSEDKLEKVRPIQASMDVGSR